MSTTVAFTNYSTHPMAHPGISVGVDAFAAGTPGTASRVFKQVNADDNSFRFDVLASRGVVVTEDGTARPGYEALTATATAAATTHVVNYDTTGGIATLTLQPAATVGAGFKMWIFLSVHTGDLTVDGSGTETVLGSLTQVLNAAGSVLEIESDGVSAWVAHT